MTLSELYRELERHDWHYQMSDDRRVYSAGLENWRRLLHEAKKIEGGEKLLGQYSKHIFSGEAFGTPQELKPLFPPIDPQLPTEATT